MADLHAQLLTGYTVERAQDLNVVLVQLDSLRDQLTARPPELGEPAVDLVRDAQPEDAGEDQGPVLRRRSVHYHGLPASGYASTQRLDREQDRLLRRVLVDYLGPRTETQSTINLLTDVLGEALDPADGPPSEDWNRRITAGLAVLPRTYRNSYTATLPGIDPTGLAADMQIMVPGLIRAHTSEGSVPAEGPLICDHEPPGPGAVTPGRRRL